MSCQLTLAHCCAPNVQMVSFSRQIRLMKELHGGKLHSNELFIFIYSATGIFMASKWKLKLKQWRMVRFENCKVLKVISFRACYIKADT